MAVAIIFFIWNDIPVKAIYTGKKSKESFNVALKFRKKSGSWIYFTAQYIAILKVYGF